MVLRKEVRIELVESVEQMQLWVSSAQGMFLAPGDSGEQARMGRRRTILGGSQVFWFGSGEAQGKTGGNRGSGAVASVFVDLVFYERSFMKGGHSIVFEGVGSLLEVF